MIRFNKEVEVDAGLASGKRGSRAKVSLGQMAGWGVILSSGCLLFFAEGWSGIVAILGLIAGAWILVDADLFHPLTWFMPIYALYAVSAPLLDLIGFRGLIQGQTVRILAIQWFAGLGFIMGTGSRRYIINCYSTSTKDFKIPAYALFFASLGFTGLYIIGVLRSGAQSKYDIAQSSDPLLMFFPGFSLLIISYMILLASKLSKRRQYVVLVSFVVAWHLLVIFFAGERDLLVRVLWVTVMLWHVWRGPVSKRWLLLMSVIGIITLPSLNIAKNILLVNKEVKTTTLLSYAPEVLNDEFYTASSNLAFLLSIEDSWRPFKYGETLLGDLQRALIPGTILRWGSNPGSWFNQEFFPEVVAKGGGRGFTFVGEGYMNFGVIGAWLWLLLLGLSARWLYRMSSRRFIWQIVYISSMPLFAFVLRSDFSILFAQFSKHLLLPTLFLFFARQILRTIVVLPATSQHN